MHIVIANDYLTERVPNRLSGSRRRRASTEYCYALCGAKAYRHDANGAVAPDLYRHKKANEVNVVGCDDCEHRWELLSSKRDEELTIYLNNRQFAIPSYRTLAEQIDSTAAPGTEIHLFDGSGSMLSRLRNKTGRWHLSGDWRLAEIIAVSKSLVNDFGWSPSFRSESIERVSKVAGCGDENGH